MTASFRDPVIAKMKMLRSERMVEMRKLHRSNAMANECLLWADQLAGPQGNTISELYDLYTDKSGPELRGL